MTDQTQKCKGGLAELDKNEVACRCGLDIAIVDNGESNWQGGQCIATSEGHFVRCCSVLQCPVLHAISALPS